MSEDCLNSLYIKKFSAWAPALETDEDWKQWALGKRCIECSTRSPALEFTAPLFRRRLSQLSRMTIQVIHDCMPFSDNAKTIFFSYWGEINAQFKINKMVITENNVMPAPFSLSVFNAAPALASIALGLRAGYTTVYPPVNVPQNVSFNTGLQTAAAALIAGGAGEVLFVYADELFPSEYGALAAKIVNEPFAFAVLFSDKPVSDKPEKNSVPLSKISKASARDFIASLYSQWGLIPRRLRRFESGLANKKMVVNPAIDKFPYRTNLV
ncbi:MAG: beta-ketoacyl synthase chain length factor, partial [Spirochaetaceae bacterium]|nr:beta-ketoacyl synthase chain length factor [Spirochaetaceae bacterium]